MAENYDYESDFAEIGLQVVQSGGVHGICAGIRRSSN